MNELKKEIIEINDLIDDTIKLKEDIRLMSFAFNSDKERYIENKKELRNNIIRFICSLVCVAGTILLNANINNIFNLSSIIYNTILYISLIPPSVATLCFCGGIVVSDYCLQLNKEHMKFVSDKIIKLTVEREINRKRLDVLVLKISEYSVLDNKDKSNEIWNKIFYTDTYDKELVRERKNNRY